MRVPAPKAPSDLLKSTQDEWDAYWSTSAAQLVDRVSDLPAVERLFSLRDERERCMRSARKGRLVEGSTGQPVLNPLYKHATTLDAQITALEDRLGLTPMARLKLGAQFGDTKRSLDDLLDGTDDDRIDEDEIDPRVIDVSSSDARA